MDEPLRELDRWLTDGVREEIVGQFVHLCLHRIYDLPSAVANIHHNHPGHAVEVAFTARVPEVAAFCPIDHYRVLSEAHGVREMREDRAGIDTALRQSQLPDFVRSIYGNGSGQSTAHWLFIDGDDEEEEGRGGGMRW